MKTNSSSADDTGKFRASMDRELAADGSRRFMTGEEFCRYLDAHPLRRERSWVITVTYGLVIGAVIGYVIAHWIR